MHFEKSKIKINDVPIVHGIFVDYFAEISFSMHVPIESNIIETLSQISKIPFVFIYYDVLGLDTG